MASLRFAIVLALPLAGCFTPNDLGDEETGETGSSGGDDDDDDSVTTTATATASATGASMTVGETSDDATLSATDATETSGTTDGTTSIADTGTDDAGPAVCGDGEVEDDEECDDANLVNTDACKNDCTFAVCGDGVVGPGEACDDGNGDDSDLCTTACTDAACGDGFPQGGEQCDDGNVVDHDGCTALCVTEPFCSPFDGFDCPSGAIQFCDIGEIECEDQDDAVAACETCAGPGSTCSPFQEVDGCNEGDGATDDAAGCPGRLNFVYDGDVCNNGIVTDDCGGAQLGTWCTP